MPGQSYYVIVDKKGEPLEERDPVSGYEECMMFTSWGEAEEALEYFIHEELIQGDEWHIERYKW